MHAATDHPAKDQQTCASCNGAGTTLVSLCCGRGCATCPGDGMLQNVECFRCSGTGHLATTESTRIT